MQLQDKKQVLPPVSGRYAAASPAVDHCMLVAGHDSIISVKDFSRSFWKAEKLYLNLTERKHIST